MTNNFFYYDCASSRFHTAWAITGLVHRNEILFDHAIGKREQ